MVVAANCRVVAFDNLTSLPDRLRDALCAIASGSGLMTRRLYSDGDVAILSPHRPVILLPIEQVAIRDDSSDRALRVVLAARQQPKGESALEGAKPRFPGAILDAASAGLRN